MQMIIDYHQNHLDHLERLLATAERRDMFFREHRHAGSIDVTEQVLARWRERTALHRSWLNELTGRTFA
jgi:hypothetical protein